MPARLSRREQARRAAHTEAAETERLRSDFHLTPREAETLYLYGNGLTYAEIGVKLGISRETVKFHLRGARWLLGAKNTREAVAVAQARGLI